MFDCGCEVEYLSVEFNSSTGAFYLSGGQNPHIQKTADAFLAIDKNIKRIEIYVNGAPDAVLLYIPAHNSWVATPPTKAFFGEIK
jgi:hypothetical protein